MLALPWPVRRLAHIARLRGDAQRAVKLCIESLAINREIDEWQGVAASLVALAQVAEAQGQPELGVRFLGKAEAIVGPTGLQLLPFDRYQHELITAQLRSQVDQPACDSAWAAGRQLSLDEAVQAALALGQAARATSDTAALTDRQREILRLLAAGQTNREIAAGMGLSVATVERHLANVYVRIGARGRADATLYAVRSGLVSPQP
jgi:DNA-binding CsgD family transcriptional regulator